MDEATLTALQKNSNFDMEYELAASAFGQAEVRMSCTQAAMVAASIINGGKMVMPYMVEKVTDCNGSDVNVDELGVSGLSSEHGKVLSTVTTEEVASKIRAAMETTAVETYKFDESLKVAAKSGTAETGMSGNAGNHAWMISCAEINGHKYAIAINWAKADGDIYGSDMKVPIEKIYRYLQFVE
jgi:peptidoglycan glycosyltransferase